MLIYLAARYTRRLELLAYAEELTAMGHLVTSRWLLGEHQVPDDGMTDGIDGLAADERWGHLRQRFAQEDWNDLMLAECCISFTEAPRSNNSRGGRHVEFGAALGMEKRSIVVGHRENVFHCLPHVEFFRTWEEAKAAL